VSASRPTLSAYEHGRKSPTVATFARLLSGAGWELAAQPHVSFTAWARLVAPSGKEA
jgi:transcriptional regulator with XRE-family HTH domain